MVREAGDVSPTMAINKRPREAEPLVADDEAAGESVTKMAKTKAAGEQEENDADYTIGRFIDSVKRRTDCAQDAAKDTPKDTPKDTKQVSKRKVGNVNQPYSMIDPRQRYTLISVVGPDVANKAYDENNELVKFHGLVVWGCVDSTDSAEYKRLVQEAAKSCDHAFDVMTIPTCSMIPLKFTNAQLRGEASETWQHPYVQELMEGTKRQAAYARQLFEQQKEARMRGETTPELQKEELDRLISDKERLQKESAELDANIERYKEQLGLLEDAQ